MKRFIIAAVLFSTAACAGTVEATYRAPLPTSASMVEIHPGVYAVADQDEPVFFANDLYWRYHDNAWYRTGGSTGSWIRIGRPPAVVLQIREPQRYQRYRPTRSDAVVIRDQRGRWHRR
jgi:hypothetical protein